MWWRICLQTTLICVLVVNLPAVYGEVMSSSNFILEQDSINFGGGLSTSTNFRQESTFGDIATGQSTSTNFILEAGYQQLREATISMTVPATLELLPVLPGLTGGTATGSIGVNVKTDSFVGYELSIKAEESPAMRFDLATIGDYDPAGAVPDYNFLFSPGEAVFGFSPFGDDIVTRYQQVAGECGVSGSLIERQCWDGLSTTSRQIAVGAGMNMLTGATTTIHFAVGVGNGAALPAGEYVATTTITAIAL